MVIIGLFLVCSASMLIIYRNPPDDPDVLGSVILLYDFDEMVLTSGSVWTAESRLDTLYYPTSRNNMKAVLSASYYCDFPVAMNTDTWYLSSSVEIGTYSGVVLWSWEVNGYECWLCELQISGSANVSYDRDSGILVEIAWTEVGLQRFADLQEMVFRQPTLPPIKVEGILLAGIFAELAVIVWQISDRQKKSKQ